MVCQGAGSTPCCGAGAAVSTFIESWRTEATPACSSHACPIISDKNCIVLLQDTYCIGKRCIALFQGTMHRHRMSHPPGPELRRLVSVRPACTRLLNSTLVPGNQFIIYQGLEIMVRKRVTDPDTSLLLSRLKTCPLVAWSRARTRKVGSDIAKGLVWNINMTSEFNQRHGLVDECQWHCF